MKKFIIICFILLLMSFAYGEEEIIVVMLEDGTVEQRQKSESDDSMVRSASVDDNPVVLSEPLIEMNSIGEFKSDDAWRFSYTKEKEILSEVNDALKESTVVVAVLDTGIRSSLSTKIKISSKGKNFTTEGDASDVTDGNGHGSHVAGIIASKIDDDNIHGVAPGVEILPIKVLKSNGKGSNLFIAQGIDYAISQNVDVINLSLGGLIPSSIIREKIKKAHNNGIIVVASAGNDSNLWLPGDYYNDVFVEKNSSDFSPIHVGYPAGYDEVIAVGSVTKKKDREELGITDFSNVSKADFNGGRPTVDVVAPGYRVESYDDTGITKKSGTSMSAPQVAGLAAILIDKYPSLNHTAIRAIIEETAYDPDIKIPTYGSLSRVDYIGQGLIHIKKAYKFSGIQTLKVDNIDFVYDQTLNEQNIYVPSDQNNIQLSGTILTGTTLSLDGKKIDNLSQSITLNSEETQVIFRADYHGVIREHRINVIKLLPKIDGCTLKISGKSDEAISLSEDKMQVHIDENIDEVTLEIASANSKVYIDKVLQNSKAIDITSGLVKVTVVTRLNKDEKVTSSKVIEFVKPSKKYHIDKVTIFETDYKLSPDKLTYDLGKVKYVDKLHILHDDIGTNFSYSLNGGAYTTGEMTNLKLNEINVLKIKAVFKDGHEDIYTFNFTMPDGLGIKDLILTLSLEDFVEERRLDPNNLNKIVLETYWDGQALRIVPENKDASINVRYNNDKIMIGGGYGLSPGINEYEIIISTGKKGTVSYREKTYRLELERPLTGLIKSLKVTANKNKKDIAPYVDSINFASSKDKIVVVPSSAEYIDIAFSFNSAVNYRVWMDGVKVPGLGQDKNKGLFYNHIILNDLSKGEYEFRVEVDKKRGEAGFTEYRFKLKIVDPVKLDDLQLLSNGKNFLKYDPKQSVYDIGVLKDVVDLQLTYSNSDAANKEVEVLIDSVKSNEPLPITIPNKDKQVITVRVTDKIYNASQTYTINMRHRDISSEAKVIGIKLSGRSLHVNPHSNTFESVVSHSVSSQVVEVKASDYATVKINGETINRKIVSLSVGRNTISIDIIAEDDTTKTYYLYITRKAAPVNKPSDNKPSGGSSSGGSSGGGIPFVPPPKPGSEPEKKPEDTLKEVRKENGEKINRQEVNPERIKDQLKEKKNNKVEIAVTDEKVSEIELNQDVVKEILKEAEELEVKYDKVTFKMSQNTLSNYAEKSLRFSVNEVEGTDKFLVSDVYEMDIYADDKKAEINVPIPIVLSYDSNQIKNSEHLGVFYFNEKDNKWEYVGGQIVEEGKISFKAKHFSKYAVRERFKTFDDIERHWARSAIEALASREITSGINAFEYAPDKTLTNAEFIVLLTKVIGLEDTDEPCNFVNVKSSDWFEPFIRKASAAGILMNTYSISMEPNAPIKREEMACLLVDAYTYYSKRDKADLIRAHDGFASDEGNVSKHLLDAVKITYELELIVGDTLNNFNPSNGATRAEAAVVIRKLLVLLELM